MFNNKMLLKIANIVEKERKRKHIMFQMIMPNQYIHEEDLFKLLFSGAPWSFAADDSEIKITNIVCHTGTLVYFFFTNLQSAKSMEIPIILF